jgi:hypothetical protein
MATIENKPAAEWIRAAKERQAKGQFDETGAREAVQRAQGQAMPDYDAKGQIVRGPSGRTYNYKPTPAKPAKPEAPKPAPEPARQVASMPKPADHASPAKPAPAPAKKSETKPAMVAATYTERTKKAGISKAVEDARKEYERLRAKNPPKPIAKPKEEMAKDIPAGKFWDEGHARAALKEVQADEAKEKAAERESYASTKRRYTGTSF